MIITQLFTRPLFESENDPITQFASNAHEGVAEGHDDKDPFELSSDYALHIANAGRKMMTQLANMSKKIQTDSTAAQNANRWNLGDFMHQHYETDDLNAINQVFEEYGVGGFFDQNLYELLSNWSSQGPEYVTAWKQYSGDVIKNSTRQPSAQSVHEQGVAEASDRMQRYGQLILKRKAEQNAAAQAAGPQPKKEEPPASSDYDSMSTRDFMKQLRDQRRPKKKGVAEATGDKPFDQMMTTIKRGTNKQKTADRKEQQKQTQQQARNAFGNMFGGGNPADKLKIREQGVAEGQGSIVDKCASLAAKYFNSAGLQQQYDIDEFIKINTGDNVVVDKCASLAAKYFNSAGLQQQYDIGEYIKANVRQGVAEGWKEGVGYTVLAGLLSLGAINRLSDLVNSAVTGEPTQSFLNRNSGINKLNDIKTTTGQGIESIKSVSSGGDKKFEMMLSDGRKVRFTATDLERAKKIAAARQASEPVEVKEQGVAEGLDKQALQKELIIINKLIKDMKNSWQQQHLLQKKQELLKQLKQGVAADSKEGAYPKYSQGHNDAMNNKPSIHKTLTGNDRHNYVSGYKDGLIDRKKHHGVAENTATGINRMFNNLGDPVYSNLQRVALLAMQGRQSEAAGRLQSVIKDASTDIQKKITDAVNNIKPVTINGKIADSSTLDKSKQHNDWIINTFIPWVQSLLGKQGVAEGSLGTALPWPNVVNKVSGAMKAMGWKGTRKADGTFMFSTRGQETDDQYYIVIIDNAGEGFFTYALGTIEEGDPRIGEQESLPNTEASVSELMNAIRDGFGLSEQGVAEGIVGDIYHGAKHGIKLMTSPSYRALNKAANASHDLSYSIKMAERDDMIRKYVKRFGELPGFYANDPAMIKKFLGKGSDNITSEGVAEGKYDPAKDTFSPETHTAITKDGKDKIIPKGQLAKYKANGWKERHSLKAFHANREKQGVAEGLSENAQDLHIGDPVIITGNGVEFEGATGEIIAFGRDHRFVVVDLYNHGRHSFHSSDVSFNEYAGSDDEEARMYDRGEFGDDPRDDMYEARMSAALRMANAVDKQRAKSDASLARTPSSIPKKEEPKKVPADSGAKTVSEHRVKRQALMAKMLNSH